MNYDFVKSIPSPLHMTIALNLRGIHEIPGRGKSNPQILGWAKTLGLDRIYKDDDDSWCALAYAYVMFKAGRKVELPTGDIYDYLRALKYNLDPQMIKVDPKQISYGDTVIFKRTGGGHIGWAVGTDSECIHTLGGNQGNQFNIIRIDKSRLFSALRPKYKFYQPRIIQLSATGVVSQNES